MKSSAPCGRVSRPVPSRRREKIFFRNLPEDSDALSVWLLIAVRLSQQEPWWYDTLAAPLTDKVRIGPIAHVNIVTTCVRLSMFEFEKILGDLSRRCVRAACGWVAGMGLLFGQSAMAGRSTLGETAPTSNAGKACVVFG